MSSLQRDRESPPETEIAPPTDESSRAALTSSCETCGVRMRADQDWCLECGGAAPGRLGARPGWRSGITVAGLTLLLLTGAVAASYAALTGDAQRDASRPSAGAGQPIVAQAPAAKPVTPGATGPGTTAPPVHAVAPKPSPAVRSRAPTGGSPSSGAGSSSRSGKAGHGSSSSSGAGASSSGPKTIKLAAATTYDPSKRAGAEFGPASNAVDASPGSVWDVTVPADNQPIGAGLVIDLGVPYKLASLTIATPVPGFDVELYGSAGNKIPPDILDSRWSHLANANGYADGSSISLKGASGKLRYVNLWFTTPHNADDPRIAIGNVTVTGTK